MINNYLNIFLSLLFFIGFISIFTGNSILLFTCLLIIFLIQLTRFWNNHIFDKLTINRSFSQKKVYPGQEIFYQVEIENKKLLPIIWLKLTSSISSDIRFKDSKYIKSTAGYHTKFRDFFNIKWYEKVKRKYVVTPTRRGVLSIYSAIFRYSDPFGFYSNTTEEQSRINLIVYPRILPITSSLSESSMLFGTRRKEGWIFQDRLNKTGVRPYQTTDSFHQINWKASARSLELKSDIYKPSLDREIHLFHGLKTKNSWWEDIQSNELELSLICAASLSNLYLKKGLKVGFYSSMYMINSYYKKYTAIKVNPGNEQRELILTTMALLKSNSIYGLPEVLQQEKRNINPGAAVIIITGTLDKAMLKIINHYKQNYRVCLIAIGKKEQKIIGINQFYINSEEDWYEINKIKLLQ